jgi:isoleucyl-tRNA synthetase
MQAKSRAYATEQIAQQMKDFKRLGVLGDWDNPYKTMNFANEAGELRAVQAVSSAASSTAASSPCTGASTAARRWPSSRSNTRQEEPHVDVAFEAAEPAKLAAAFGLPSWANAFIVIWTTTAWTIPANQALNLNPEIDYALVDTPRACWCWPRPWSRTASSAGNRRQGRRHGQGREAGGPELQAPAGTTWTPATAACRPSTWPTTPPPRRHRHRALGARLRRGRLQLLRGARPGARRHPQPRAGQRQLRGRLSAVRRQHIWKAVPVIIEALKDAPA